MHKAPGARAPQRDAALGVSQAPAYRALIPADEELRLAADVWPSRVSSRGAVVFVHGFCGGRAENGLFHKLAAACSARGFHAVLYDWRGIGLSEGNFTSTGLDDHVADFKRVVEWTRAHFGSEAPSLSAVGFSLGAALIGSAVRDGMDLGSVAYLSPAVRPRHDMWPRYNTPEIMRELSEHGVVKKPGSSVFLGEEILESLRETDLGPRAFDLETPLLVCHGSADTRIDCASSRKLKDERERRRGKRRSTFRYEEFPGASHSFRPEDHCWDRLGAIVAGWVRQAGRSPA